MEVDSMAQQVLYPGSMVVFLMLFSCGALEVSPVLNANDPSLSIQRGRVYFQKKVFSGKIFTLYEGTDDTASIQQYRHGMEHGQWVQYYPTGELKETRSFINGEKTGEYLAWWKNGNLMLSYHFVDDEYEGTCREWNESGRLITEMNYHRGYESGSQKVWYDNGKIKSNYVMASGRRYGLLGTKNCVNVSDSIY